MHFTMCTCMYVHALMEETNTGWVSFWTRETSDKKQATRS